MNRELKFRIWDSVTKQYLQELGKNSWHVPYSLSAGDTDNEGGLWVKLIYTV